jgi:betaine reductase
MDPENQAQVKKVAQGVDENDTSDNLVVVLGASDIEGALISAETVTSGDPSFTGPLAGVSLGLPVYHILEQEMEAVIPERIYEENVGIWQLTIDTGEISREFKAIREKAFVNDGTDYAKD